MTCLNFRIKTDRLTGYDVRILTGIYGTQHLYHEKSWLSVKPRIRSAYEINPVIQVVPQFSGKSSKTKVLVALKKISGPGFSKLTTPLVNVLLKFQMLISQIHQYFLLKKCEKLLQCKSFSHFCNKNFSVFGYKVIKHLTSWPLNELVKLTMLWTTGPRTERTAKTLVLTMYSIACLTPLNFKTS